MFTKRMKISIVSGAVLGMICIIGAWVRSGLQVDATFLFALWYNRLVMGLVIGLSGKIIGWPKMLIRGAFFGLIVSFAFYLSTGFNDIVSFIAGIVYGIIIEYFAFKYGN